MMSNVEKEKVFVKICNDCDEVFTRNFDIDIYMAENQNAQKLFECNEYG